MSRVTPDESSDSVFLADQVGFAGTPELKAHLHLHLREAAHRLRQNAANAVASSDIGVEFATEVDTDTCVPEPDYAESLATTNGQILELPVEQAAEVTSDEPVAPAPDLLHRLERERLAVLATQIPAVASAPVYATVKRFMDILGAVVGLILFGPIMVLCAVLIKCQDGGPILFRQDRVGEGGKTFEILKFRSMIVNADALKEELMEQNEHDDDRTFKILNDPRITQVGRFMRRLSLDELPQFWNVLWGQMSLVGPRPALPSEVVLYEDSHLQRLSVPPGLTCIWQVSGRSNLDFQRQMQMDLDYIQERGVWVDSKLILQTLPAVFRGEGAA